MIKTIQQEVKDHPFFKEMPADVTDLIAGCGKNLRFNAGEHIAKQGTPADQFYLVREGTIAIKLHVPGRGAVFIQTAEPGEIVGWSWLFPPYQWMFDVDAQTDVALIALDGLCLRNKCDADPKLGYDLMKRFSQVLAERIGHTRLQLLDVYG
ncbi:MAG: cyclic nucleotide-binding domain-containing protein [Bdellovibrionales bacterium]|nr:cyclic nucleotide-binding domain-containing protein [Bdellovibrionales bacterium]